MNEHHKDIMEGGLLFLIPIIEWILTIIFAILAFLKIATDQTVLFFIFIIYFFVFDMFIIFLRHAFSYDRDIDDRIEDIKNNIKGFERLHQDLQNNSNIDEILKQLEKEIVKMKKWVQEGEQEKIFIKKIFTRKRRDK